MNPYAVASPLPLHNAYCRYCLKNVALWSLFAANYPHAPAAVPLSSRLSIRKASQHGEYLYAAGGSLNFKYIQYLT